MPHIVIEYSQDLEQTVDVNELMAQAYNAAAESEVMDPNDLKVRAMPYAHFMLADHGDSFVHVACRLLAGRSEEQKIRLATLMRRALAELLPQVHSISIEIIDMQHESYKKRLLGS